MVSCEEGLIAGAGPVGLAAALFLTRQGRAPRIVDPRAEPTTNSRALAVNPRTLEILEPFGVTQQMLAIGLPVVGACFHRGERCVGGVTFEGLHARYPYMLALSQASTERLLERALYAAGRSVERGTSVSGCDLVEGRARVTLEARDGRTTEKANCRWVLAADGAHSTVRKSLGIEFRGSAFSREWYLADTPLRTDLPEDRAHIFFHEDGAFVFLLRVVDEQLEGRYPQPLWRVITNRPDPLSQVVRAEPAGEPIWTSSFHIAHRIVDALADGPVYFAGDAAHIHSPLGARGMNLGIEDAWVFAQLALAERLPEYDRRRRPVDARVVRQVQLLSRVVAAESTLARVLRTYLFPLAIRIPALRSRMLKTLSGLDHPLPLITDGGNGGAARSTTGQSRRRYTA